jgi:hypothetical protein
MAMTPDEAIGRLQEFFPERAKKLATYLELKNSAENKIEKWRENQLVKFIRSFALNADELERAFRQERITTLAWAVRNILELSVWVDYCNIDIAHATRFREDSARDLLGLTKAIEALHFEKYGTVHAGLRTAQNDLESFATSVFGMGTLGDDFERVVKAADELGWRKRFLAMNKILSKYAHPTAWAVNAADSIEADAGFREMFLLDGIEMASASLTNIRRFILLSYPI